MTKVSKKNSPTRSMTGFGQGKHSSKEVLVEVELKSVNHRYLDLSFRLPPVYSRFESQLGESIRKRLRRGHVDINVVRRPLGDRGFSLNFNRALFDSYWKLYRESLERVSKDSSERGAAVLDILRRREVLDCVLEEAEVEREVRILEQALDQALDTLVSMRAAEGKKLEQHLSREISQFEKLIAGISRQVPASVARYREKLEARVSKLKKDVVVDQERLAQEVVLFAERLDVTEELTRLESHLDQWQSILVRGEGGRKLEFLLQEMGREVNTIGSKSQSPEISSSIVELKAILEKLREQIQNVE